MSEVKKIATRESYGETLVELGAEHEEIVVLDADLAAATKTGLFQAAYPERFINCGIAESNMIGVAAGLAAAGKVPFASSFAMFAAGRAYEQVRNSVGYPHLNVKIGATHAGISVGEDGATHQCNEDIALMRTIVDAAKEAGISAVIAADVAVMAYCCEVGQEVHLSTQLNISNAGALKFYARFADVVVLARELNLKQVRVIYDTIQKEQIKGPNGELVRIEMFCHGALCMAVSGKCYLSLHEMNASANRVVAVDIPSGLAGEDNTWNDPETIVCAEYTFTFQFPKLAFMLAENEKYVGRWEVLDIGLHPEIIARQPTDWFYTTEDTVKAILPPSPVFAHKGTNGKGLLIAGSYGMMGAAVLGAKAAVRSGIGLLYCHIPGKGIEVIQTTVPEAIPDPDESAERFSAVCKLRDYDAIAVGPAIGQGPETVGGLEKLLRTWRGTTILDADALNIIAEHRELLDLLHEGCILTPHMKEFERLAGKSVNDFERLNKLSIFANQYRVHIVLKGAHSVIATPDRRLFFNMSGNPGMAKGGAGDVLTGVLLALAANKLNLLDLLRIGVFAHGLAGDCVAEKEGRRGCCAGMIAERMGEAWKRLEK